MYKEVKSLVHFPHVFKQTFDDTQSTAEFLYKEVKSPVAKFSRRLRAIKCLFDS